RHHEGYVRVHAPGARLVDDDGAGLHSAGRVLLRRFVRDGVEHEVTAFEGVVGEDLYFNVLLAEADALAGGPRRGQELERSQRKRALFEETEKLCSDDPCSADHGDVVTLGHFTPEKKIHPSRGRAAVIIPGVGVARKPRLSYRQ